MRTLKRVLVWVIVGLVLWTPIAWFLANSLIIRHPIENADAILVLSGSSAYVERTRKAAELFRMGVAPKILLTNDEMRGGWDPIEQRNPTFAELERRELIRQGVPNEAIETLPLEVNSTNDEAKAFVSAAGESRIRSTLLITSQYHTRRALWAFRRAVSRQGLEVELGIDYQPKDDPTLLAASWWFRRNGWRSIGLEYVKIVYYWAFY